MFTMSSSKFALCEICKKEKGIYSCPRCGRKYCSSPCYKSKEHELCSESFYREWVESSLSEKQCDDFEKDKMVHILKKFHDHVSDSTEDELSITDRFSNLNIDDLDEDALWQNLSREEQNKFKILVEEKKELESLVHVKQPWWTVTSISLVTDICDETPEIYDISSRPFYPLNVKKLSCITTRKPSECIQFNLVNILYAYAFLNRFYNCEIRDFLEDVVRSLYQFSPVLSEGKNYYSLEEAVQDSVRLILNSDLNVPLDFIKSIVNDASSILQGPMNTRPSYFVLCALNDIELLYFELRAMEKRNGSPDKTFRSQLLTTIKKLDYYMSWSLDFECGFSELSSDLLMLMLPDLLAEPMNSRPEETAQEIIENKSVIEEIE